MATLRVAAPSRASAFSRGTAPVALRTGARPVASKSRGGVTVRAGFFDFLQPKEEEEAPAAKSGGTKSICLDCGYIAVDLAKEPFWYKCPVCGVGKNRFKPAEEAGSNYRNLMAAKQAAKKAKASAPKGQRPRDLLRERAIEMAREKDAGKGGKTGKGWF